MDTSALRKVFYNLKFTICTLTFLLFSALILTVDKLGQDEELLRLGSFILLEPRRHQNGIGKVTEPKAAANLDIFLVQPYLNKTAMALLPNLSALSWPNPSNAPLPTGSTFANKTKVPLPGPFEPVLSRGQRSLLRHFLRMFSDFMFSHGYGDRFWLNAGTLVGTYNHHDFVPWDDDVDVLADITLRPRIQQFLNQTGDKYGWYSLPELDKLFTKPLNVSSGHLDLEYSRKTSHKPWPWPFFDIGYYHVVGGLTCRCYTGGDYRPCFSNSIIFPLIFRPFGREWYPAPCNTPKYLRLNYHKSGGCVLLGYSHVLDRKSIYKGVPCHMLAHKYAFVSHNITLGIPAISTQSKWNGKFVMDQETLLFKTPSKSNRVVHSVSIPLRIDTEEFPTYGVPEPR